MSESNQHSHSNLDGSSSLMSAYEAFLQQQQQPDRDKSSNEAFQSMPGRSMQLPPPAPPPPSIPVLTIKISKSIVNFDNVKIPRRLTEGRGPLFAARPELQDWIQNKMMTYDDEAAVKAAELLQQQPTRTVIVDNRVDMMGQHVRLAARSSSQKPSSSLSSSSSRRKNAAAAAATTSTSTAARVAPDPRLRLARSTRSVSHDKLDGQYSSEGSPTLRHRSRPRSRSSTRRSKNSSHSSRECGELMDNEEEEEDEEERLQIRPPRPFKRRRQFDHDDEDGGGRPPSRPSRILHITWLGDEGLPSLGGSSDGLLTQVMFKYFNNMVKTADLTSVERLSQRPFYTWLIYPSPKHAQLAMKFIQRCVEKEKKFLFKYDGIQYRFSYKVDFSWKKFWNPPRHPRRFPHERSRASSH